MAFASDITLNTSTGGSVVFTLTGNQLGQSDRIATFSTLSEPWTMHVKHQSVNRKGVVADRHLTQFKYCKTDSAGVLRAVTVNFTIDRDRTPAITDTMVYDLVGMLVDFLRDGAAPNYTETQNVGRLLRNEI